MKPDDWRLQPSAYPFRMDIATRFGDLDRNDHINNVAAAQLYEELRVRFAQSVREAGSEDISRWTHTVVAEVRISYLREMSYPAPISGGAGILRLGNSSYQLGCALFQHGQCASICEVVLVCVEGGRSQPIPQPVRDKFSNWLIKAPGE